MTRVFGPALLIAVKDLRQRLRDRSAIVVAFVAPLGIAAIISLALGNTGRFHATFAVADLDGGPLARAFVDDALGSAALKDVVTVRPVASADEARSLTAGGKVSAAFVIPAGFSETLGAGRPASIRRRATRSSRASRR